MRCPTSARWRRTATIVCASSPPQGPLKIAACYPRAVKWLFAAAGAQLPDHSVRIWNMRVESADTVIDGLVNQAGQTGESGQDVESRQDGDAVQGESRGRPW